MEPYLSGTLEQIQKLIPILSEMEYDELLLSYEDCGIWRLEWSQSKLTDQHFELKGEDE